MGIRWNDDMPRPGVRRSVVVIGVVMLAFLLAPLFFAPDRPVGTAQYGPIEPFDQEQTCE